MSILITACSGTIGSRVSRILKERNILHFNMTSNIENISKSTELTKYRLGNFKEHGSFDTCLSEIDTVCLITPASPSELEDGVAFIKAAKRNKVKKIVLLSIHKVEDGSFIPHFKSKIAMTEAIKQEGLEFVIIKANNFNQNDLWFQQALIEYGVYPQPYGNVGLSRVDADDIALAMSNAATSDEFNGQEFPLVGSEVITADKTAELYTKYLEKPITYRGNNLDSWEQEMKQYMPDWLVEDWKIMYEFFQKEGLVANEADLTKQEFILGKKPISFESFVERTCNNWKN